MKAGFHGRFSAPHLKKGKKCVIVDEEMVAGSLPGFS